MAQSAIPGLDVYEDPRMSGGAARPSPEARVYQDMRSANMGPQPQPQPTQPDPMRGVRGRAQSFVGSIAGAGDAAERMGRVAGDATKAAGMRAGSIAQSAGTLAGAAVKGVAKNTLKSGPLSAISEVAPHAGFYSGSGAPAVDVAKVGIRDAMAAAGGVGGAALGAKAGVGFGAAFGPWGAGIGGVVGGLAGGYYGARGGGNAGSALTGSDDVLRKHGFDPNRSVVDMAADFAQGKSAEQVASPTLRAGQEQRFPPAAPADLAADPTAAGPTAAPAGNFTSGRDSFQGPSTAFAPPNPAGTIRREGNSYSGTGDIKFGADITNPRNAGAGVSVLPSGPGGFGPGGSAFTADMLRGGGPMGSGDFSTLRDMNVSRGVPLQYDSRLTPEETWQNLHSNGPLNFSGFGDSERGAREQRNSDTSFQQQLRDIKNSNMKPRDQRAAMALAVEMRTAGLRERGEMSRAQLSAATQNRQIDAGLRGQDQQFALGRDAHKVQREGHDVQREGHMISAQGARAKLMYDMNKDQRDYTAQRNDKGFEQGQQAIKDLHQEIGSMIPPARDGDGKQVPDTANAARYATAMQTLVGRMGKTMKDIDASDKARFVAGMQLADVASATATGGMTPWGTRAIQSNEPILALRKLANGDYQTNRKGINGETEVIPARYIEKEGSVMGFGGRASNKFKALME